jgi:hypothetical protein
MEQNRVSLQQAKMLKEVGYDVPCAYVYSNRDREIVLNYEESNSENSENISRPTLNEVCDWLREVHGLHVYAVYFLLQWKSLIQDLRSFDIGTRIGEIMPKNTYQQALSAGIDLALSHIKTTNDGK